MSPILGAGGTGYDDYQRTQNWDSAELYSFTAPPSSSSLFSPVLAVPRWAYIEGYITVNTGPAGVSFTWFTDALGLDTTGIIQFVLSPLITAPCQFRFPNMGPYVQAALGTPPIGTWGATGRLFASNRVQSLTMIPQQPVLIDLQAFTLSTGGNPLYPGQYFAGPVSCWAQNGTGNTVLMALQYLTAAGNWDYLYQSASINSSPGTPFSFTTPIGAWRIFASATIGGAGNYLAVTPAITGAS